MQMNLKDAIRFLFELESIGWKLDLDRIRAFLEELGNPQESFSSVHIAGTNGKGSVAAMLASILLAAGKKTGMYTSPHLVDLRERVRVNDIMIKEQELVSLVQKYQQIIKDIGCTFFEAMTGLSFRYFSEKRIEIAVVEVGLGGRLDATNILQPIIAVITNIAYDHMEFLGDSLKTIAFEKGGIIKPGIPVIIGEMPQQAANVLIDISEQNHCPVYCAAQIGSFENVKMNETGSTFDLITDKQKYQNMKLALPGPHQLNNACTAVLAAERLSERGIHIGQKDIYDGLKSVKWPGRFTIVRDNPLVILDVAHNEDGMRKLIWMLRHFYPKKQSILIMGVLKDKDYRKMVECLPIDLEIVFTVTASTHRSLPAHDLATVIRERKIKAKICDSVRSGIEEALQRADSNQLICITGSHYVVGEALKIINILTM